MGNFLLKIRKLNVYSKELISNQKKVKEQSGSVINYSGSLNIFYHPYA